MSRLPTPGGDGGSWGQILNDFLSQAHNSDGTLKDTGVVAAKYVKPGTGIPKADLSASVQASLDNADAAVSGSVPDADAITKGKLKLAGDLSGTADLPTVAAGAITDAKVNATAAIAQSKIQNLTSDLSGKQPLATDLTMIAGLTPTDNDLLQRKAGAWTNRTIAQVKTDLAVTKSDVGLGNVDNTSDATKDSAFATLNNKTIASPVINGGVSGTAIDTDTTLTANSDTILASQKATKTYVDTKTKSAPTALLSIGILI